MCYTLITGSGTEPWRGVGVPMLAARSAFRARFLRGVRQLQSTPYSELSIGVPKETVALERRVAQTPETVTKLVKAGFTVKVEKGAGVAASFSDASYEKAGASIVDRDAAFACASPTAPASSAPALPGHAATRTNATTTPTHMAPREPRQGGRSNQAASPPSLASPLFLK